MHRPRPRILPSNVHLEYTYHVNRFYACLDQADMTISFVEVTSLRQITHLSFKLATVGEAFMRTRLLEIYRKQREEIETLKSTTASLSSTMNVQAAAASPSNNQRSTRTFAGLSNNFVERCRQLEEQLALLDSSNTALKLQNNSLQQTNAHLETKANTLQSDFSTTQKELHEAKEVLASKGYSAQIQGLQTALRDKDAAISRLNDLLQSASETKAQLESSNSLLRDNLRHADKELGTAKAEISKANEIIRKTQEEVKQLKSTSKSHSSLLQQQQGIIEDLRIQYDTLKQESATTREALEKRSQEVGAKEAQLKTLKRAERDLQIRIEGLSAIIRRLNSVIEDRGIDPFAYSAPSRHTVQQQQSRADDSDVVNTSGIDELLRRYNNNNNGGDTSVTDTFAFLAGAQPPQPTAPANSGFPRFLDEIRRSTASPQIGSSSSPPATSSSPSTARSSEVPV